MEIDDIRRKADELNINQYRFMRNVKRLHRFLKERAIMLDYAKKHVKASTAKPRYFNHIGLMEDILLAAKRYEGRINFPPFEMFMAQLHQGFGIDEIYIRLANEYGHYYIKMWNIR